MLGVLGGGESCVCCCVHVAVQILLPVYGSSCLVALVLHRRSSVVGRCVFRLYGLLPLLLRDYNKSLVLYRYRAGGVGCTVFAGYATSQLMHWG
jgi:hypothetical protein